MKERMRIDKGLWDLALLGGGVSCAGRRGGRWGGYGLEKEQGGGARGGGESVASVRRRPSKPTGGRTVG